LVLQPGGVQELNGDIDRVPGDLEADCDQRGLDVVDRLAHVRGGVDQYELSGCFTGSGPAAGHVRSAVLLVRDHYRDESGDNERGDDCQYGKPSAVQGFVA